MLIWFIFCGVVAYFASQKGRNPVLWGILAIFTSPLLAGLGLAFVKDLEVEEEIDELHKDTENIKREVKANQQYNQEQRKKIQNKLTADNDDHLALEEESNDDNLLEAEKVKCGNCDEYVLADNDYCTNCGSKVVGEDEEQEVEKCPNCQIEVAKGAKFCQQCGQELVIECPNCNLELDSDAKFCAQCGEEIIEIVD
ncbi:MAG: zinc ribbon domain-containing protein [Bacillota bacterium]